MPDTLRRFNSVELHQIKQIEFEQVKSTSEAGE